MNIERIYLISTVGQARNAWRLTCYLQQDPEKNYYFVLRTMISPQVEAATKFLSLRASNVKTVSLPDKPNSGRISTIRRTLRVYEDAFRGIDFRELWIANTNNHYSAIASKLRKDGREIYFYEDGLGSYKNRTEFLSYTPAKLAVKNFLYGVGGDFKKFSGRSKKLAFSIGRRFSLFVFSLYFVRKFLAVVLRFPENKFFDVYDDFSGVYVFFPDLLDPQAFLGPKFQIEFDRTDFELTQMEMIALNSLLLNRPQYGTLYVSQMYGSGTSVWNRILSEEIKKSSSGVVYIKFHPRERWETRQDILAILLELGVQAIDIDPDNTIDCLKIIANFEFDLILGLTSSVLFYAPKINPALVVATVAENVLLTAKPKVRLRSEYDHLMRDYKVFKRFWANAG